MTREEAIAKVRDTRASWTDRSVAEYVDGLIALGVLKVDTPVPDCVAAVREIETAWVQIGSEPAGWQNHGPLSVTSAQDIIGKLLKSGFKITRG